MNYILHAFLTIILLHHLFYNCTFSLMGNRGPHFLGFGHLMRPITELFISCGAAHHYIPSAISTAKLEITLLPPQAAWCVQRLISFSFFYQKKFVSIILCSANNYPPVCNENCASHCYEPH